MPVPTPAAGDDRAARLAQGVEDGRWVRDTLAGDRTAFDRLVVRYQRQAVAVSFRLLGNANDALEVSQEAFLKAFRSLATLDKPDAFGGWLLRIVSNLSLNRRRDRAARGRTTSFDPSAGEPVGMTEPAGGDSADPLRRLEGKELGDRLRQALDRLPDKQRSAILLFTIEQMPQKEVAEVLDCSVEAVKWHVFQGRKKLKEWLGDLL